MNKLKSLFSLFNNSSIYSEILNEISLCKKDESRLDVLSKLLVDNEGRLSKNEIVKVAKKLNYNYELGSDACLVRNLRWFILSLSIQPRQKVSIKNAINNELKKENTDNALLLIDFGLKSYGSYFEPLKEILNDYKGLKKGGDGCGLYFKQASKMKSVDESFILRYFKLCFKSQICINKRTEVVNECFEYCFTIIRDTSFLPSAFIKHLVKQTPTSQILQFLDLKARIKLQQPILKELNMLFENGHMEKRLASALVLYMVKTKHSQYDAAVKAHKNLISIQGMLKILNSIKAYSLAEKIYNAEKGNIHTAKLHLNGAIALRCNGKVREAIDILNKYKEEIGSKAYYRNLYFCFNTLKDRENMFQVASKLLELGYYTPQHIVWFCINNDFSKCSDLTTFLSKKLIKIKHNEREMVCEKLLNVLYKEGYKDLLYELDGIMRKNKYRCSRSSFYKARLHVEDKSYDKAIDCLEESMKSSYCEDNLLFYVQLLYFHSNDYQRICNVLCRDNNYNLAIAKYHILSLIKTTQHDDAISLAKKYMDAAEEIIDKNEFAVLTSFATRKKGKKRKAFDIMLALYPESDRKITSKTKSVEFTVTSLSSNYANSYCHESDKISVIMTNYGYDKYTHCSIRSVLNQTHKNIELLIIDDHSPLDKFNRLNKLVSKIGDDRVKLIRSSINNGTYKSKNIGIKKATGTYITFQDSDDWSHPNRLIRQLEKIKKGNQIAVMTRCFRVQDSGEPVLQRKRIITGAPITLFFKKDLVKSLGFFDSVRTSADSEYIKRIKAVYGDHALCVIEEPYYVASYHSRSLTNYGKLAMHPILGLIDLRKKYLDAYTVWHSAIKSDKLNPYIDFPLSTRTISAPPEMVC